MKFIPLSKPYITDEIKKISKVLKSGWLTSGPKTEEFENKFARYVNAKHALAVATCTDALHISLASLNIKPGDEIITTPMTFIATSHIIEWLKARPVFVDIQEDTFNINPDKLFDAMTFKTKAIIPVHMAGHPCDMKEITKFSKANNLSVIEDAAHAPGAEYKDKKIGSLSYATCFSFYATKNMTTGEGGMITTNEDIKDKLQKLSYFGIDKEAYKRYDKKGKWYYEVDSLGYKCNMDSIHAAIGIEQLKKLDSFNKRRRKIAELYTEELEDTGIITPIEKPYVKSSWHLYIIRLPKSINRAKFIDNMAKNNVGCSVHFLPIHLHPYYRKKYGFKKGDFPVAEKVYENMVSLPIYPLMSNGDVEYVIKTIKRCLK